MGERRAVVGKGGSGDMGEGREVVRWVKGDRLGLASGPRLNWEST